MDTSTATSALLLLNLPVKSLCGIDLLSFTTTPQFHGIRNIPPGYHLIFTGADAILSLRSGTWFYIPPSPRASAGIHLLVKRWDGATETLADVRPEELEGWRPRVGGLWREGLTPYRQMSDMEVELSTQGQEAEQEDTDSDSTTFEGGTSKADLPQNITNSNSTLWTTALTSYLTASSLERITGGKENNWTLSSASSASRDTDIIPGLDSSEVESAFQESLLHFLPVDLKITWRKGAIGSERTKNARDRSWAVEKLLASIDDFDSPSIHSGGQSEGVGSRTPVQERESPLMPAERVVLGELQFCFLAILTLSNYSCLQQWKRLLSLLLTCKSLVSARAGFFEATIRCLHSQLDRCDDVEGGLFDLRDGGGEEGGAFLRQLLRRFRSGLDDLIAEGIRNDASALELPSHSSNSNGKANVGIHQVDAALSKLEAFCEGMYGWSSHDDGRIMRAGRMQLEDGEEIEVLPASAGAIRAGGFSGEPGKSYGEDSEEETGEYAPMIVET